MKKIWSILLMILLLAYMPKLTASAEGENLISASPKGGSDVWCEYGGETVLELQIEAKDETKLSYQWSYEVWSDIGFYMFKDIEGATDNTYVIENCNDFQTYRCTVTDEYGEFEFVDFFVRVNNEFEVKAGDSSYNVTLVKVAPNTSAELEVHVSSKYEGANKCRWVYYDINNECWDVAMGNDIYKITTDLITREERYYCIVEDKFGNKGTAYFYVQPDNQLEFIGGVRNDVHVEAGGTAKLKAEVTAYDRSGIEYTWYHRVKSISKDGEEVRELVEGALDETLEVKGVERRMEYVCVVTDNYGSEIEKFFDIYVENQLTLAESYKRFFVKKNSNVELEVEVSALDMQGITYEWYLTNENGSWVPHDDKIIGADNNMYTVENVQINQEYCCRVIDKYNNVREMKFDIEIDPNEDIEEDIDDDEENDEENDKEEDKIVVEINETSFPGEKFREYVKESFDKNQDGMLSSKEINDVKDILFEYKWEETLQGIEYFVCLEWLDCSESSLKSLDVSNNVALKYLDCSHNNITTLIFGENQKLEQLKCYSNSIRILDISSCPLLVEGMTKGKCNYPNVVEEMEREYVYYEYNGKHMITIDDATMVMSGERADCFIIPELLSPTLLRGQGGDVVGGDCYQRGEVVILEAIPKDGFGFAGWWEDNEIISYDTTLKFTAKTSRNVTARFEPKVYQPPKVEDVFADIKKGDWYVGVVQYVRDKKIMAGKELNGTMLFSPNDPITRAEFATVLYNKESKPMVTYVSCFSDVADGKWFTSPVVWVYGNGIAKGYGNTGKFGVGDYITREQMAQMLYSYSRLLGYDLQADDEALEGFADADRISSWAVPAMKWATYQGIMKGSNEEIPKLNPQGKATRAECAAMIKNMIIEVTK